MKNELTKLALQIAFLAIVIISVFYAGRYTAQRSLSICNEELSIQYARRALAETGLSSCRQRLAPAPTR